MGRQDQTAWCLDGARHCRRPCRKPIDSSSGPNDPDGAPTGWTRITGDGPQVDTCGPRAVPDWPGIVIDSVDLESSSATSSRSWLE